MSEQLSINIDVARAKAGLDQLKQSFSNMRVAAEQSVSAASASVQRLNTAMQSLRGINPQAVASITQLNRAMAQISSGSGIANVAASLQRLAVLDLSRVVSNLNQISAALRSITVPPGLGAIASQLNQIGSAASSSAAQMRSASGAFNAFGANANTARGSLASFGGGLSSVTGLLGGFGVALGGAGFAQFITSSYDAMNATNSFNAAMTSVTGSADISSDAMAFVSKTADNLAIDLNAAMNGFKDYSASALLSGQSLDQVKTTFTGVATAARVLNLGVGDTMGVFRALSQIAAKGKVQMEELRQQIGDRMPGAIDAMARAVGVGKEELFKMVTAGEVGADILPKFGQELEKTFGPGLTQSLNTTEAAWQRLMNGMFRAQVAFGDAFFAPLKKSFDSLASSLNSDAVLEGIRSIGAALGQISSGVIGAFSGAASVVMQLGTAMSNAVTNVTTFLQNIGLLKTETDNASAAAGRTVTALEMLGIAIGGLLVMASVAGAVRVFGAAVTMVIPVVQGLAMAVGMLMNMSRLGAILTIVATGLTVGAAAFGLFSGEAKKAETSTKAAETSMDGLSGSTETLKDNLKITGEASKNFEDSQKKLADGMEKVESSARDLPGSLGTLKDTVTQLNPPFGETAKSSGTMALTMESLSATIPNVTAAFTGFSTALPAVKEPIAAVGASMEALSGSVQSTATALPNVNVSFAELAGAAESAREPVAQTATAFSMLVSSSDAISKLKENFVNLIGVFTDSSDQVADAVAQMSALGGAAYGVSRGFEEAETSGGNFAGSLAEVNAAIGGTIAMLEAMKTAAENALKAAQQAASAGQTDAPSNRYGGYSDGTALQRQTVDTSAFSGAPQFAEGTANTSKFMSKVSGGGIPSILHPNEAVIPLSRGREVPVALDMSLNSDKSSSDIDLSPLNSLSKSLQSLVSSLEAPVAQPTMDLTVPALEANVKVSVGDLRTSGDRTSLIPPQGRESTDGLFGSSAQSSSQRDNGNVASSRAERSSNLAVPPANVTININAADVDSFNRSKDQLYRELDRRVNRANRRSRN